MNKKIRISVGKIDMKATLSDGPTSNRLWEILPISASVNTWGEEIYFEIPLEMPLESSAREEMAVGEIAYWPPGKAFCIFFGPTPASTGEVPRAASAVNPLGDVEGDVKRLLEIQNGEKVQIERAQ